MARTKGMLSMSGNLEVNAQAPLDARTIVSAEADLTVASNFPYPYIGLEVYVTDTGKKYRLTNLDTTQSGSWHEIQEGGGSGGGGHTIQDDGTDMTARNNLNFKGMELSDNQTDGSTDVEEHRLTSAEIAEMMTGLPNPQPKYPVILDERGTEYVVGWYVLSNGTRKPLYQKTVDFGALPNNTTKQVNHNISNIELVISVFAISYDSNKSNMLCIPYLQPKTIANSVGISANKTIIGIISDSDRSSFTTTMATIQYTKTTDTPV